MISLLYDVNLSYMMGFTLIRLISLLYDGNLSYMMEKNVYDGKERL